MDANLQRLEAKFLKREDLEFIFDVSTSTVDEWTKKKLIASFKCGRNTRYEPAAVLDFLARYTLKPRRAQDCAPCQPAEPGQAEIFWERIQRLIADQVRAEVLKQMGSERGHMAA